MKLFFAFLNARPLMSRVQKSLRMWQQMPCNHKCFRVQNRLSAVCETNWHLLYPKMEFKCVKTIDHRCLNPYKEWVVTTGLFHHTVAINEKQQSPKFKKVTNIGTFDGSTFATQRNNIYIYSWKPHCLLWTIKNFQNAQT